MPHYLQSRLGKLFRLKLSFSIVAASDTELVARENAIINDFVEKDIKQVLERKERVYRLVTSTNR